MIVAFYHITTSNYNFHSNQPDLDVDYDNVIDIKDMDIIPGIKSIVELEHGLFQIQGAEAVRYELDGAIILCL